MLVIFLVFLFAFGCQVHAKESLDMKFDRSDKLINRNQRDAESFYGQVADVSYLDTDTCDLSSCASSSATVCDGFCTRNTDLANQAYPEAIKCLNTVPCNSDWEIDQVEIPIAIQGYDGTCTLSGNPVTVSGGNNLTVLTANFVGIDLSNSAIYSMFLKFDLTYSGLTVTCTPSSTGSSNSLSLNGSEYSISRYVYWLLCFLSNLLGLDDAGLSLCFLKACVGGSTGSTGSPFSASVTVEQSYIISFYNNFFRSGSTLTFSSVTNSAQLGSGVPSEYEELVKTAVELVFNDYNIVNGISENFVYNIDSALYAVYNDICPKCPKGS